jgi:proteasome lid subunit RPN8/RPN11
MFVYVDVDLLESLLAYARDMHPHEILLLLRGRTNRNGIYIDEVLIAPSTVQGKGFASFNPYMLPIDSTIIGTVHSHPSGVLNPSVEDLNHMYGMIMMILAYPYRDVNDVSVFNKNGEEIPLEIV